MLWQRAGAHGVTIVVKATFGIVNEASARLVAPVDLVREDRYRSGAQSLDVASELAPYLPSAGVVLTGHAQAPQGRPAPAISIRVAIFREHSLLDKTLHVIGYRPPHAPTKPLPFQDVPIVYERAYGGPGVEDNPVGTGVVPGSPLPNIVDPADPRRPAGFGPIARHWSPRKRLLNGLDPALLERPIAEIPEGFDWRYFHAAPVDQQIDLLRGDEWIVLDGLHPSLPRVQTRLPSPRAEVRWHLLGEGATAARAVELCADTLVIDAKTQTLSMVWRGHILLDHLDGSAPAGDPFRVLGRMQVFAGVGMPHYPISWPGLEPAPEEIIAPLQRAPASSARAGEKPDIAAPRFDAEESTTLVVLPSPAREGVMAPSLEADDDDDPQYTMLVIDPQRTSEPALPFRAATGESAHIDDRRPAPPMFDPDNTTLSMVSPFMSGSVLPFQGSEAPPAREAPSAPLASMSALPFVSPAALEAPRSAVPFAPPAPIEAPRPAPCAPPPMMEAAPFPPAAPAAPSASPWAMSAVGAPPPVVERLPPPLPIVEQIATPPSPVERVSPPSFVEPPESKAPAPPALLTPFEEGPRSSVAAVNASPAAAGAASSAIRDKVIAAIAAREALDGLALAGADLSDLDLSGRSFAGQNLRGAIFCRADLSKASFVGAQLLDADFTDAVLTSADLSKANLAGASFRGASLREARLHNARGASTVFDGAKLEGASAEGAELEKASLAKVEAEGSNWDRAVLNGSIWTGAKLKGASMLRATVNQADFSGADLSETKLQRMTGEGVGLAGANLEGTDLRRSILTDASFEDASFTKASADKADLSRSRLTRADLRGSSLRGTTLKGVILVQAKLDGTDLRDADLEQANLFQSDRKNAKMAGANLKDVREVDPDRG